LPAQRTSSRFDPRRTRLTARRRLPTLFQGRHATEPPPVFHATATYLFRRWMRRPKRVMRARKCPAYLALAQMLFTSDALICACTFCTRQKEPGVAGTHRLMGSTGRRTRDHLETLVALERRAEDVAVRGLSDDTQSWRPGRRTTSRRRCARKHLRLLLTLRRLRRLRHHGALRSRLGCIVLPTSMADDPAAD
jgi:hypothetical protein